MGIHHPPGRLGHPIPVPSPGHVVPHGTPGCFLHGDTFRGSLSLSAVRSSSVSRSVIAIHE